MIARNSQQPTFETAIVQREPALGFSLPASAFSLYGFRDWLCSFSLRDRPKASYIGGEIYIEDEPRGNSFIIPAGAVSLAGFQRWSRSNNRPEGYRIDYVAGEIFIDMSPESIDLHNKIKTEVGRVLSTLVREGGLGLYYTDGAMVGNIPAGVYHQPDGMFASRRRLLSGEVTQVPRSAERFEGLEGSPDWIMEIVSKYSVRKDTVTLPRRYFRAGVAEFWLIDPRGKELQFTLFTRGKRGFLERKPRAGWHESTVFPFRFSLQRNRDEYGYWSYNLHFSPRDAI